MKKRIVCLVCLICVLAMAAGCTSSLCYTFTVDTGDSISVELDTTDQYHITSKVPFTISCDGADLTQGTFIKGEGYAEYVKSVEGDARAQVIETGTKDGNEYIFWNYNNEAFHYAILVGGSNTGILLGNDVSEESAKECFDRLTISVAE